MENQFIVTPYFLDRYLADLDDVTQADWVKNAPDLSGESVEARMGVIHEGLARAAETALRQNRRPVSIQGDCCATIGFLAGLRRAGMDPWLLWLDAHGDFNTHQTTPSGFLGGMPLAMIAGLGDLSMNNAVGLRPFPQARIILTDGRDLDPDERELVERSDVHHIENIDDVRRFGFDGRPLYVHFDIDILNPKDMNSGNYLAEGGPRAEVLGPLFRHLAKNEEIAAVSMTTWTPGVGDTEAAKTVSMRLLDTLLGA